MNLKKIIQLTKLTTGLLVGFAISQQALAANISEKSFLGTLSSPGENTTIYCTSTSNNLATCGADDGETQFQCSSSDPSFLATVRSMTDTAVLLVSANEDGSCHYIATANTSKNPAKTTPAS